MDVDDAALVAPASTDEFTEYGRSGQRRLDGAIDTLVRGVAQDVPRVLYHYTKAGVGRSIIETRELWARQHEDINSDRLEVVHLAASARTLFQDAQARAAPVDGRLHFDTADEAADAAVWIAMNLNLPQPNPFAHYILSLTEDGDSPGHWDQFGDGGKGVCVALEMEQLLPLLARREIAGQAGSSVQVFPVRYGDDDAELLNTLVDAALAPLREGFAGETDPTRQGVMMLSAASNLQIALWYYGVLSKRAGFRSEREWRIVVMGPRDPALTPTEGAVRIRFERTSDGNRHARISIDLLSLGFQPGPLGHVDDVLSASGPPTEIRVAEKSGIAWPPS